MLVGDRIGYWEIIGIDNSRKRAACCCRCGTVRTIAIEVLQSGASESCGCALPSKALSQALKTEVAALRRRRERG
jgi:hypothetical protein